MTTEICQGTQVGVTKEIVRATTDAFLDDAKYATVTVAINRQHGKMCHKITVYDVVDGSVDQTSAVVYAECLPEEFGLSRSAYDNWNKCAQLFDDIGMLNKKCVPSELAARAKDLEKARDKAEEAAHEEFMKRDGWGAENQSQSVDPDVDAADVEGTTEEQAENETYTPHTVVFCIGEHNGEEFVSWLNDNEIDFVEVVMCSNGARRRAYIVGYDDFASSIAGTEWVEDETDFVFIDDAEDKVWLASSSDDEQANVVDVEDVDADEALEACESGKTFMKVGNTYKVFDFVLSWGLQYDDDEELEDADLEDEMTEAEEQAEEAAEEPAEMTESVVAQSYVYNTMTSVIEAFEDLIDKANGGDVDVEGMKFGPSEILKALHREVYEEKFHKFLKDLVDDGQADPALLGSGSDDYMGTQEKTIMATEYRITKIEEAIEELKNFLDDNYGPVDIAGLKYNPSEIIMKVDETAWRTMVNDYVDQLIEDGEADPAIADESF